MSQIQVVDLTFAYEGSFDFVFEHVSFSVDSDWKLGLIGRNGKGKTTLLRLLLGEYPYSGTISASVAFGYFPYPIPEEKKGMCLWELMGELKPESEEWRVICEFGKLGLSAELMYRPFGTLSHGERTKALLALLFSGKNDFLLVDEPTNHLEQESRETVKAYLKGKKGFILVSHDRDLLDECADHVLVLNRQSIEVQAGNFSSWWENKARQDHFAQMENEKHLREIASLKKAAARSSRWAEKSEGSKIGFDPVKDPGHGYKRAYIGGKTKKLEKRAKQFERRMEQEIKAKEGLLADIEEPVSLKLAGLPAPGKGDGQSAGQRGLKAYHKERLVYGQDLFLVYSGSRKGVLENFSFELRQGERVFLCGRNGSGKSTLIKLLCGLYPGYRGGIRVNGIELREISMDSWRKKCAYVEQSPYLFQGTVWENVRLGRLDAGEEEVREAIRRVGLEELAEREISDDQEVLSGGERQKISIARALLRNADILLMDEPGNNLDKETLSWLEGFIRDYRGTMLFISHDERMLALADEAVRLD